MYSSEISVLGFSVQFEVLVSESWLIAWVKLHVKKVWDGIYINPPLSPWRSTNRAPATASKLRWNYIGNHGGNMNWNDFKISQKLQQTASPQSMLRIFFGQRLNIPQVQLQCTGHPFLSPKTRSPPAYLFGYKASTLTWPESCSKDGHRVRQLQYSKPQASWQSRKITHFM